MAKVQKLSDIQQEIAFTEFDFYLRYEESFKITELAVGYAWYHHAGIPTTEEPLQEWRLSREHP